MSKLLNIFLTGSSGFIGKNFVEKLDSKYNLYFPSHSDLDLTDTSSVDKYFDKNLVDIVIHTANIGGKRNDDNNINILNTNLKMFLNLLRNKSKYKKMIYFGSGAEYDKTRDIVNIKETDFGNRIPVDDYGLYKYICSQLIENTNNIYCLRLFGVFGKYEDISVRFISNILSKYILKQPLLVNQDCLFDYICVNDLIKIIDYFVNNSPKDKYFNVGTGSKISLIELADKINNLSNYKMPIVVKEKGMNLEYTCNCDLLQSTIPNFTFTPIDRAINNLYNYYLNNNILAKNE